MTASDEIHSKVATSSDPAKWPKCDQCGKPSRSASRGWIHTDQFLCGACNTAEWEQKQAPQTK